MYTFRKVYNNGQVHCCFLCTASTILSSREALHRLTIITSCILYSLLLYQFLCEGNGFIRCEMYTLAIRSSDFLLGTSTMHELEVINISQTSGNHWGLHFWQIRLSLSRQQLYSGCKYSGQLG